MKISIPDPLTRDILVVESLSGQVSQQQVEEEIKPTLPLSEFRVVLSRQPDVSGEAHLLARLEPVAT